jgi:hypothetical protein
MQDHNTQRSEMIHEQRSKEGPVALTWHLASCLCLATALVFFHPGETPLSSETAVLQTFNSTHRSVSYSPLHSNEVKSGQYSPSVRHYNPCFFTCVLLRWFSGTG